ncbi:MAG: carbohydrate-binding domain-containing protein [Clostridia bacterium]|nr:carbohydrate-binding domain-containing protein [Clostridia bacterium]
MYTLWKKAAAAAAAALLGLSLFGCSELPDADAASSDAAAESTASDGRHEGDGQSGNHGSGQNSQDASADVPSDTDFSNKDLTDTWAPGAPQITLSGDSISCSSDAVKVDGTTATVTAAGSYLISGSLSDGQILVEAGDQDDVQLVLDGADITCSDGPAIYVKSADKVILTLADGKDNRVTDGKTYADTSESAPNAAIYAEEDLSVNGEGSLTVDAQNSNGIATKDDLKITSGTITVTAPNHALKGKDSVSIGGGTFVLTAGGDGIQSDQDSDPSKGWIIIDDGSFTITAENDGIQAETGLTVHGGEFNIATGGGSENAEPHTPSDSFGGGFGGAFGRPDGGSIGGFDPAGDDSFGGYWDDDDFGGFWDDDDFGGFDPSESNSYGGFGGHHGGMGHGPRQAAETQNSAAAADSNAPLMAAASDAQSEETAEPSQSADQGGSAAASDAQTEEGRTRPQRPDAVSSATEMRPEGSSGSGSGSSSSGSDSSKGLKSSGSIQIDGGIFELNCSDDGVHSNADISLEAGKFRIASGDDAVHADGSLVTRADIEITESYEGIEGLNISIEDGTINLVSSDDGINASGNSGRASVSISGGVVNAQCGGDGIDSNGDITVSGGDVTVLIKSSADNCAMDTESTFTVTGGTLIYGGTGTGSGPQSGSTQSYVYTSGSFSAGETVSLRQDGRELMQVTPAIDCTSLIFSQPGIESGASYEVYSGSTLAATVTAGQGGSGMIGGHGGMQGFAPNGAGSAADGSGSAARPQLPTGDTQDGSSTRPQLPSGDTQDGSSARPQLPSGDADSQSSSGRPQRPNRTQQSDAGAAAQSDDTASQDAA